MKNRSKQVKTNRQYINGANFERKVKKWYEGQNLILSRAAGSHGPFDLQGHDDTAVWDIQCKYGASPAQAKELLGKLADMLVEKYPVLRIPIIVSVAYAWEGGIPRSVITALLPNLEKISEADKTAKSPNKESSTGAEKTGD